MKGTAPCLNAQLKQIMLHSNRNTTCIINYIIPDLHQALELICLGKILNTVHILQKNVRSSSKSLTEDFSNGMGKYNNYTGLKLNVYSICYIGEFVM